MFDAHPNLASGTILTAPTDIDGQVFELFPGDGDRFEPNMPVTLVPSDAQPAHDNAEIGYVTAVEGDTLTISRGQEGTLPRLVRDGWRIYGAPTRKTFTDIEDAVPAAATDSDAGIIQLAGDVAGTASAPKVKTRTTTATVGPANADYITDGTADNVQIQAAIDQVTTAGGSVFIQRGSYSISSPIRLKSNVHLTGEGMYLTRLFAAPGWGSGALLSATTFTPADPLRRCIVEELELDGSNMATTPYQIGRKGIDGHNMENCMFRDLHLHDTPATGLGIDNLCRVLIDHCYIKNSGTPHPPATDQGSNGVGLGTGGMTHESVIVTNCITEGTDNPGYLLEDLESVLGTREAHPPPFTGY